MQALLIDGPFAHQNVEVGDPPPEVLPIESEPIWQDPHNSKLEVHSYRNIGIEPNPGGLPLAIYRQEDHA